MSMTAGTRTLEGAPITSLAGFSEIEVGLRVSPAGGVADYVQFDNVSVVPEPASLGLLGACGAGAVPPPACVSFFCCELETQWPAAPMVRRASN